MFFFIYFYESFTKIKRTKNVYFNKDCNFILYRSNFLKLNSKKKKEAQCCNKNYYINNKANF